MDDDRINSLAGRWLLECRFSPTTRKTYGAVIDEFRRRASGEADPFTVEFVVTFLTSDAHGGARRQAPNTLKRYRTALRSFLRWTHARGHSPDLSEGLAVISFGSGTVRHGRWLSPDECRRLLQSCHDGTARGVRDEAMLATDILTGLRAFELVSLSWRDVDIHQRRIRVLGKGSKPAVIGLPVQAAEAVERWRRTVESERPGDPLGHWPLFPRGAKTGGLNGSEEHYEFSWHEWSSTRLLRSVLGARAARAQLGHIAPHDLRRTFAGLLDQANVDLRGIQAALRHESPQTTVRHYLAKDPLRAIKATSALRI